MASGDTVLRSIALAGTKTLAGDLGLDRDRYLSAEIEPWRAACPTERAAAGGRVRIVEPVVVPQGVDPLRPPGRSGSRGPASLKRSWNSHLQGAILATGQLLAARGETAMRTGIATRRDESHRVLRLKVFGSATHGTSFDPATSTADFLMEFDRSCGSGCLRRPFAF